MEKPTVSECHCQMHTLPSPHHAWVGYLTHFPLEQNASSFQYKQRRDDTFSVLALVFDLKTISPIIFTSPSWGAPDTFVQPLLI